MMWLASGPYLWYNQRYLEPERPDATIAPM
jgi:hypothetical protein